MKREINCPECAEKWRRMFGRMKFPSTNENGEGMRHIDGRMRLNCTCDGCGKDLLAGDKASAVTIFSIDYREWEDDYIVGVPE